MLEIDVECNIVVGMGIYEGSYLVGNLTAEEAKYARRTQREVG